MSDERSPDSSRRRSRDARTHSPRRTGGGRTARHLPLLVEKGTSEGAVVTRSGEYDVQQGLWRIAKRTDGSLVFVDRSFAGG